MSFVHYGFFCLVAGSIVRFRIRCLSGFTGIIETRLNVFRSVMFVEYVLSRSLCGFCCLAGCVWRLENLVLVDCKEPLVVIDVITRVDRSRYVIYRPQTLPSRDVILPRHYPVMHYDPPRNLVRSRGQLYASSLGCPLRAPTVARRIAHY